MPAAARAQDAVDDLRELVFQGCELYPRDRHAARREPRRPASRPAEVLVESAATSSRSSSSTTSRARQRRDALPWVEDGAEARARAEAHEARDGELFLTFCPSGFWAISKVIERRVVGRGQLGRADAPRGFQFAVRPDPTTERDTLAVASRASLFAASDKVDQVKKGGSIASGRPSTGSPSRPRSRRRGKSGSTASKRPTLLVLLSHTTESSRPRARDRRRRDVPRRSAPARRSCARRTTTPRSSSCSAAIPRSPTSCRASCPASRISVQHSSWAHRLGARPASRAGGERRRQGDRRGSEAAEADGAPETSSHLRRKLLAKGELTALCLTAFGDAGWQLGGKKREPCSDRDAAGRAG